MRCPRFPFLTPLLALALATAAAAPALPASGPQPSQPCADALTTPEVAACLARQLAQLDQQLAAAFTRVQSAALAEPGDGFRARWRSLVARHGGGEDPALQLRRFQAERRRFCVYAWSLSLQGTGFGSFVSGCELALSRTLLRELSPR